ncbi:MAG: nucleoside-triphosphatase [Elusimicrobiaceae bacterium]|jgi:nucleoside-triphosphatase THEP1
MIFLITGPKNSGKTLFTKNFYAELTELGVSAAGIATEADFIDGKKTLYRVLSLRTGKSVKLLEINNGPQPDRAGFDFADQVLGKAQNFRVIFVDEFGPLEAAGGGYAGRVLALSRNHDMIITVRPSLAEQAREIFAHAQCEILSLESSGAREIAERIKKCLLK